MIEFAVGERGVLSGHLVDIRFRNERSGWLVADFELDDGRRLSVVGTLAAADVGTALTIAGEIERDTRFGLQFRIEEQIDPELTVEMTRVYLGSGLVPYIGPSTAGMIVDALGADTLPLIMAEPVRLLAFRGVTPARLPAIRRGLRETANLAAIVGLLKPFSVSMTACRKVHRRHGARAVESIRANPWRLAHEISGVGFRTADRIALGLGCARDDEHRVEAAVIQALTDGAAAEGHIVMTEAMVVAGASALCQQQPAIIGAAIRRLVEVNLITATTKPSGFALPRLAAAEQAIAAKVRLIAGWDEPEIEVGEAELAAVEAAEGIVFDDSQKRAIRGSLSGRLAIITGNPGTGKTTIVRAVLDIAERRGLSVALASPTGRAAKRLAEATGRPASTIHRFLRYHPDEGWRGPTVLPDLLVVDEASMLDSPLAARLLSVLPPYTRVLLVGDADQLPAVGPGNVLGDLIASPQASVFRLRTIHRTARGSAVPKLAAEINAGVKMRTIMDPVTGEFQRVEGLSFDGDTARFVYRDLADIPADWDPARPPPPTIADWIGRIFRKYRDQATDITVLCPMKNGPIGTHALNRTIQEILNPARPGERALKRDGFELRPRDRILQTHNNYDFELFNGDIGQMLEIKADGSLTCLFDGVERSLPPTAAEGFTLAYAMTVHKAQGSEFPLILVPMHSSTAFVLRQNGRRLFYTAVSRASRTVVIIGQPKAVNMAIREHDPLARQTLLRAYLTGDAAVPEALIPLDADEDF